MEAVWDFLQGLPGFLYTWLPLIFLGLLVWLMWKALGLMPRVKPNFVEPASKSSVTWTDVAGVDEAAAELQEVVDFLLDPRRFGKLGARVPKGILLYGPPGSGKTLLAKAVANASGANFYSQSASAFVEMFAGLGASRIRKLFGTARKNAPAIVFIDELDAVGMRRSGSTFNREHDQSLNQLLVELDGFGCSDEVVIVGASNRIEDLDAALLRPGRFDRQVVVAPPDFAGRGAILGVHTRGKPLADDVKVDQLARQTTAGLTGADLANVCNAAEEIVFGAVTNGAANDLERVTAIARAMVFEFGMGGQVSARTVRADNYALSEQTKQLRDPRADPAHRRGLLGRGPARAQAPPLARRDRTCAPREGDDRPRRAAGDPRRHRARVAVERLDRHTAGCLATGLSAKKTAGGAPEAAQAAGQIAPLFARFAKSTAKPCVYSPDLLDLFQPLVRPVAAPDLRARATVRQHDVGREVVRAADERRADPVGVHRDAARLELADPSGVEAAGHDDLHALETVAVERVAHLPH